MTVKKRQNRLWVVTVLVLLAGCAHIRSFQGVHTPQNQVSIPKKAGAYPGFSKGDTLHGSLNPYRQYDVGFYSLDLDIDIEQQYLKGKVTMRFQPQRSLDTLQIDLYRSLSITKIVYEGEALNFTRTFNAYYVIFPKSLSPGKAHELQFYYQGYPREAERPPWKGGLVWEKDEKNNPWVGVACEGEGASLWWPCKDHMTDEPDSVAMRITVPGSLVAVSNGQLRKVSRNAEKRTFYWRTQNSINLYNVTFYIGDYKLLETPYVSGSDTHQLAFYTLSYHDGLGRQKFGQIRDMLHFFEDRFGTYPWWQDGYKLVDAPYAGMEHQTAIAFGSFSMSFFNFRSRDLPFDYILVHETAHEWWGNSVTADDMAHLWLHEAFATYSEVLYLEDKKGYERSIKYLNTYKNRIKNKRPLVQPEGVYYFNYKDTDIYAKGAWLLHTLRSVINNDSLFFDILRSFAIENRKSLVSTKDFVAHVKRHTERQWDAFFQQYLYQRRPPVLECAFGKEYFYFRWGQVQEGFAMPVEIYRDGKRQRIYPVTGEVKEIPLEEAEEIIINTDRFYLRTKINTGLLP